MKFKLFSISLIVLSLIVGCKKDNQLPQPTYESQKNFKTLNSKEQQTVDKFKHASFVLRNIFSEDINLRLEFNGFIAAKLNKTETDEELTFKEIFEAKNINLPGVQPDFLMRFREAFVEKFINGNYPESVEFQGTQFTSFDDVANYFDFYSKTDYIPFEIYFPYSENFLPSAQNNYAVTFNPLDNDEENYGTLYNFDGSILNGVTINDDFAYETPTYIVTYDDGLSYLDFTNGNPPIETKNYTLHLTDTNYNPITLENRPDTATSPCTKELRVKDGRWRLIHNGYGLFEGKIEFAVATSLNTSEVTIPNQNPQSNPIIQIDRTAHAFGYKKMRRRKVKNMKKYISEYVDLGFYISPWCSGEPDKMMYLYEYDKPYFLASNAKEWSGILAAGAGLIGDSVIRAAVSSLASAGLAPLIKSLLEGTAESKIEHYSIIGSNAVYNNQGIPSNGMNPSSLNGYRPYGTNDVMVTLVVD